MNKTIYLGTTYKCSACKLEKYLLLESLENHTDIELIESDFSNLPDFIKTNIKFTDFPVVILVKDNVIKYHFVGTMRKSKFEKLLKDIDF